MAAARLRVAVVCSSNQNRSMEAHRLLSRKGFAVSSFGTAERVKLPGPALDKPNVYDFGTTYDEMYSDLVSKDRDLYTRNGVLHMLRSNRRIKPGPEHFRSCTDEFDLILTCDEKVYDDVVRELTAREQESCRLVHVVNVDIKDTYEEARLGAILFSELCQCVQLMDDVDSELGELLLEFEEQSGQTFLHTVCFY